VIRALEGLQLIREEKKILKEIRRETENREKEEAVARAAKELRKTSAHSVQSSEWSQSQGILYFCGKIYVPDLADLRQQIISLCYNTKIAGHCSR
jgi:hypothetical protein